MRRHFHKMHGLGNDFVIIDAREEAFDVTPALARAIADRRTGDVTRFWTIAATAVAQAPVPHASVSPAPRSHVLSSMPS